MDSFKDFNLSKQLYNAINELGFDAPTPIQSEAYKVVLSGKDIVGVAQTGTGKTLAYMMPILQNLKFSNQIHPRVMILVPTRELVIQVVDRIEEFSKYMNIRVLGVFGGRNINTQSQQVLQGTDIIVATPGRLYDLVLGNSLQLKSVKQLVIDEVDVMLDLGFKRQISNIFELLPEKRQNIMFSATMTDDVAQLIDDSFIVPQKIAIALSGTPLENISQLCYKVENFYTKVNLLIHLLSDQPIYQKVLVFAQNKKSADKIFEALSTKFIDTVGVIHSNKSQNFRIRSIEDFDNDVNRILVATDIMARGIDLSKISHVINFDVPNFPENYMHRIGRTGRAEKKGNSLLFYTKKEEADKKSIELLMGMEISEESFPQEVEISKELTADERPLDELGKSSQNRNDKFDQRDSGAFHEKKEKNQKTNLGGSYKREISKKYKKSKTRGDKTYHKRQKRG
ncbi:DEAD/DEAH box helicase [Crocinitomicaceae bacterium]|nr:DEAD/DEAH box helicase [Crocinitomicaceae bacterium]